MSSSRNALQVASVLAAIVAPVGAEADQGAQSHALGPAIVLGSDQVLALVNAVGQRLDVEVNHVYVQQFFVAACNVQYTVRMGRGGPPSASA